jgi:hypothetical protein
MYKLLLGKLREVSAVDAMDLLELNTYEGQRPLRPKHIAMLRGEIENGRFLYGDIAIARLDYEGKREVLVNGQHQLKAEILADIPIRVIYQVYSCQTPEDVSDLFRRFDNHASRSLGDTVVPESLALGIDWKPKVLRIVVSAAVSVNGAEEWPKSEKVRLLGLYVKQGGFVNNIVKESRGSRHLLRASVVRAMMETYDKDWQSAKIFWEDVRDGAELKKNDPALLLKNYLQMTAISSNNRKAAPSHEVVTSREMYVKCLHAWNASRSGTKTNLRYLPDAPIPRLV